jgi:hypothetical protein
MSTQYLHVCTLQHPFPNSSELSMVPPLSDRTCSYSSLLFSDFVGKKKMLSFVQDTTQRVCLWQFCVYMYYNAKWFISIIFLLSILDPLLMVISSSLKILYSFLYREYIYHINLFNFLLYTPSFICYHPLVWPFFHNIAVFVLGLYSTYERKHATFDLLNLDNFP